MARWLAHDTEADPNMTHHDRENAPRGQGK